MTSTLVGQQKPVSVEDAGANLVERVLAKLGTPKNLYRVDVKKVFGQHHRVNVYCTVEKGLRVDTILITDSFFVTLTEDGLVSQPAIERKYA